VTRGFVNRLLRLRLLAPDIVEAILEGRQTKGGRLEDLMKVTQYEWEAQPQQIALASGSSSDRTRFLSTPSGTNQTDESIVGSMESMTERVLNV
jgi:hypothetical protein